jgi:uncharacterized membrane protein
MSPFSISRYTQRHATNPDQLVVMILTATNAAVTMDVMSLLFKKETPGSQSFPSSRRGI